MLLFYWHACYAASGLFFIIPCTDTYSKVDLRTVSFDVPPQEVSRVVRSLSATLHLGKAGLIVRQ